MIKVKNLQEAWKVIQRIYPTSIFDDGEMEKDTYFCTDSLSPVAYVRDYGVLLEVNLDNGSSYNIWIEDAEESHEKYITAVIGVISESKVFSNVTINEVNICERFGAINENGNVIGLQERFQAFGVSQLGAMLPMPDTLLEQCDSKMSVRALKQLCEDYKESLNAHQEVLEDTDSDVVDSETIEETAMNEPTETIVDVIENKAFVCQASTFDEFVKLQDIVKESLEDMQKKYPHAKIHVEITY